MSAPISKNLFDKIHRLAKEHPTISNSEIARKIGIGKDAVAKWRRRTEHPDKPSQDIRFVAWPDTHLPSCDGAAVDVALKLLHWYKPQTVIILGDFLDCAPVSHWLKDKKKNKTREGLRLKDDYNLANELLDRILIPSVEHLVYLEGNHEDWIRDAIDASPELDGLIDLALGLKFEERRRTGLHITHLEYGKCWNLGQLYFTHGTYTCMHHAKKHVEAYARNIVYGHLHDVQMHIKISPIDVTDIQMGLCLGCLADKNPKYMENRPNNWVHAIGLGTVRADGTFNIDPIIIVDGKATYAGKTFSAR